MDQKHFLTCEDQIIGGWFCYFPKKNLRECEREGSSVREIEGEKREGE